MAGQPDPYPPHPAACSAPVPSEFPTLGTNPMQGQERVRKTSLDLRREIIDVGGIQNLIELRKKRKQKKRDALAAAQEPPPEPEEIVRVLG